MRNAERRKGGNGPIIKSLLFTRRWQCCTASASPRLPPFHFGYPAQGALTAGVDANTAALNATGCYATTDDGGWGFCGPLECNAQYRTCRGPATGGGTTGTWQNSYSAGTCEEFIDKSAKSRSLTDPFSEFKASGDATCAQVTTGICASATLAKIAIGDGFKYAYCNDKRLVIGSTGEPGVYSSNLDDVPSPPGGTGGVTGEDSKSTSDKVGSPRPRHHGCPDAG